MAPKKKGNKKAQNDDWEADLGESIVPQDAPAAAEDAAPEDEALGGGLLAALQKRGKKKNKKGAADFVEGEDPPVESAPVDLESKAPQEGTFEDDDEDVFAGNYGKKKGKGGAAPAAKAEEPADDNNEDGTPRVKTKAEKEREKKEKEKQRKKELVGSQSIPRLFSLLVSRSDVTFIGCEEESNWPCQSRACEGRRVEGNG